MESRKLLVPGVAVAVLILLVACGSSGDPGGAAPAQIGQGEYRTLSIDAFADILANQPDDYTIVNVHIPYAGEVEGTDANIPYDDLDALMAALPDKNAPIILYCRSGNMSNQAAQALLAQGYAQVWDVPGGMNAWIESGRELINR